MKPENTPHLLYEALLGIYKFGLWLIIGILFLLISKLVSFDVKPAQKWT
jgi:hypothetical protein